MDSASLQNLFKRLSNVLYAANVTNPLTYVEQIAYLIFLKMMEEMETEQQSGPTRKDIFIPLHLEGYDKEGEVTDFTKLRWSILTTDPDNERMLRTLRDLLPRLAYHSALSPGARSIFDDARIMIPDGATLRRAVDIISPVHFLSADADVKGDLFETLSSDLGQQKRSAQFRTPRHLIRVIVEMVNPQIGGTVCDSACGTGGFLIGAWEHLLLANSSPQFTREVTVPGGLTVKRGYGDKLTPSQWEFLQRGTMHGFDGEQTFVRMTAMNALLHGFDHSPIVRRDGIGGSEDKWDEVQFDYILENPPFSGASQSPKRSLRVEKGDKYVLFLAAALRSLRPGGRAGIVLPNGILYGETGSHMEVKKRLLTECDLQAVVNLPQGMFEPYTPNPTCFLIFQKTGRPTENVWFYNLQGDGSSLAKARKFGPQYRNDFPDLLAKWHTRSTELGRAWLVSVDKIVANKYNLTLAGLGLVEPEKIDRHEPEHILARASTNEQRVVEFLEEMQASIADELDDLLQGVNDTNWKVYSADELFEIVSGQVSPLETEYSELPYLGPEHVESGTGRIIGVRQSVAELKMKSGKYRFTPEHVIYSKIRPALRKVCTPDYSGLCSADMYALKPRPKRVTREFLKLLLLSPSFTAYANEKSDRNAMPKINQAALMAYRFRVPEVPEQERIASFLNMLLAKHAELRRLQTETEAELAAFTPALLAKAFRGEL